MACDCMCGCIWYTVFSKVCSVGSRVWRSQPLEIKYCSDGVHRKGSIDIKRCEGEGNWRAKREGLWETGDRKQGRRVRERERETEGDRRRKSLRHGWMRLLKMAAWAEKPWNLRQQLRSFSSWEVEARRLWLAHSFCRGISSRKHLLSTSFCWFLGFLSLISVVGPVGDITYSMCVTVNILMAHTHLCHYCTPISNGCHNVKGEGQQFFIVLLYCKLGMDTSKTPSALDWPPPS